MNKEYIERLIYKEFERKVRPNKVLILLGARRVGKTELIKRYLQQLKESEYVFLNGESYITADLLSNRSVRNYERILGGKKLLIIDEAQKIPDIGLKLKLMVDEIEDLKVIVTGSSIFDLSNKLGEPLVGRENTLHLFPLSQGEFSSKESYVETVEKLEERLIFGSYPELEQYPDWNDKADYLEGLVSSYLLRDILEFEGIRKSDKIMDLLRLIAFQVGKEVNVEELANSLKGITRNTVENYLDLLSKVFVIYKVRGFSRNLRKEVTKSNRWYFYDNGIRNAIIRNFNPLNSRSDIGELWENYLFTERLKNNNYLKKRVNYYYWRTYDQQELDLVEEEAGQLRGFEFKWNVNKKAKRPGGWSSGYPEATFECINKENYLDFIL